MRNNRLYIFIMAVFLLIFISGCARIGAKPAAAPVPKEVRKETPAPVKPSEAKQGPSRGQETAMAKDQAPAVKVEEVKRPDVVPVEPQVPAVPPKVLNRNAVGCILPLSGRFAEAGNRALDAVMLSADLYNRRYLAPWKIVVADSGESAADMQQAVAYLAEQANVSAIVAVVGSTEAMEAAREAEKRKVPLILITSKEGVTDGYEYVFQHFLTPSQQMEALSRYALDRLNVAIFSILYPQDDYGDEMVRLFRQEIQKVGGKVTRVIPYSKSQTDFTEQIFKLAGQKGKATGTISAPSQEARGKMFVDFEALFIPDSPLRLKMIASQLAFYDVKGVKLLGTSLWHTPDLMKKGADYLEGAVFVDCFLVNGVLPETNDFVDIYYSAYSREPESIDALSYDTMEIVLSILEDESIKTRDDFKAALLAVDRFSGATGNIAFRGRHVAQKTAFMMRIMNGKLEQVR